MVVNSGWRDTSVQSVAKSLISKEFGNPYAVMAIAAGLVTPHSTGGACDLELWSLQIRQPLSYSYPNDLINAFILEQKTDLNKADLIKRRIRRILFHVLTTPEVCLSPSETLTIHPGEFWHFGDGDPLSAYLNREKFARYGHTRPPQDFKYHGN